MAVSLDVHVFLVRLLVGDELFFQPNYDSLDGVPLGSHTLLSRYQFNATVSPYCGQVELLMGCFCLS
jgi:hypothetical protein